MEVPGIGQQEPGAAAAPSEEIDLSLDDIIKRNQKAQPNRKPWRHQLKTRNPAFGSRRPRFQSWGPPTLPGSSRFPKGFRKPPWARKPFWSRMSTPGPRAAGQMQGRSPLNRPAFAQQDKPGKAPAGRHGDGAPQDSQPEAPARAKAFRTAGTTLPFWRPFRLNQGHVFRQSRVRFNFNQRQIKSKMEQRLTRVRRPGPKRPFLRRRNSQNPQLRWQPRGVMLRFNFRAMANQTSVTLNERFSGLRHKRNFSAERNTSRMVTLP
ncbi:UAP56-interacting factor-like isoform X4 [Ahaetulla prasina]|uniref:UAP56-interacting factor-like isoform X4 n=1 Tax=Ahaetulla prasina TaxID=499056 RepID=UPI0026496FF5|nr:UAP56-interacting factor-like isoform X4 [Ahaetulla prasina]